jgi:hypothetical protein
MPMTDYHFVSSWRLQAPIERVWEEVVHTERWPSWWKYVHRVDQLDPGDADGLGRRQHLVFTTRLPYRLGFDIQVHRIQPPKPRLDAPVHAVGDPSAAVHRPRSRSICH